MNGTAGTERAQAERRRENRASLNREISIRERGRNRQRAILTSLSCWGCSVSDTVIVPGQQTIWIRIPGIESQVATLRWAEGASAGFAFEYALHPAILANLLAADADLDELVPGEAGAVADDSTESAETRRQQILSGHAEPAVRLLARKQPRQSGTGLQGLIARRTSRVADHRRESRYPPPENGSAQLRDDTAIARVLDISTSGLQVELVRDAEIGSSLPVDFEGFTGLTAQVVWIRDERAGLALPAGSIELCESSDPSVGTEPSQQLH